MKIPVLRLVSALLLLSLLAAGRTVSAHDLGVSEAYLVEGPNGHYILNVAATPAFAHLFGEPRLPERCAFTDDPRARRGADTLRYAFACTGRPLSLDDRLVLPWQREGVLLTARWDNGAVATRFFPARGGTIAIDLQPLQAVSGAFADVASRYTVLGIEHILFGIDHLLFVLGLMLIVRGPWMLLKTVTAFTIAHSVTLALATLGLVEVPSAPVEASIALSIVFVAAEGLRGDRQGLALRRPWLVAFGFGLLHGFGFAGALSELGLPPAEVPLALLFFNIGVEIGQVAFVAAVLGLGYALRHVAVRWPRWTRAIPAYAIGSLAMVWFIERVVALPGG